jgi:hypothetical protein
MSRDEAKAFLPPDLVEACDRLAAGAGLRPAGEILARANRPPLQIVARGTRLGAPVYRWWITEKDIEP